MTNTTLPAEFLQSPELLLKREVLIFLLAKKMTDFSDEDYGKKLKEFTSDPVSSLKEVESLWTRIEEEECEKIDSDTLRDFSFEFRETGTKTGIESRGSSRHYECLEVAKPVSGIPDLWIGWTYWYDGGKHGDPDSIEWIPDAYLLTSKVEMKPVTIFERVEDAQI